MDKTVFYSIITRNHGKFLPHYFRCLDEMDYDKKLITVYFNTNNNDDNTLDLISEWFLKNNSKYKNIIIEKSIEDPLINKNSNWDEDGARRLKKMAFVRNRSLDICKLEKTDYYFVMDTDNWVCSDTLKFLIKKEKPIIAPFIKLFDESSIYSNFFTKVDNNGYYSEHYLDRLIWRREQLIGTLEVPLVHCTYLIDCNYLKNLSYTSDDKEPFHYEFSVFSHVARKNNIQQYICNEKMFGFVNYWSIIDKSNCYELMLEKYKKDNNINKNTPLGVT